MLNCYRRVGGSALSAIESEIPRLASDSEYEDVISYTTGIEALACSRAISYRKLYPGEESNYRVVLRRLQLSSDNLCTQSVVVRECATHQMVIEPIGGCPKCTTDNCS